MSENAYSFTSFKCHPSEPTTEWFFCLVVMGVMFTVFFALYFYRICYFHINNPDYSYKSLISRILFAFSLLMKAVFSFLMGIGFLKQTEFSVFKYLITDLPDFVVCSALSYILYSWCQVFLYCGVSNLTNSLSYIQMAIVLYNSFTYLVFSILFCLRCVLPESSLATWHAATLFFLVIDNLLLACLFIMVLIIMKKQLHFTFSCNLGNPEHYLFTLCCFFIAILLVQTFFNLALSLTALENLTECSELKLVLTLCTECIGQLLPLGFISIVDVISLPPPEVQPAMSIFDD
ncbi:hypothetical protein TRFO_15404 [Tritrichomonas foetus]|uniref:Uncharacterized protein n=1 Tax=Tritrichomonas foetus TaxID=1144522 RepID=A0A1J4KSH8_9EUKA|nr:hypothetical protein TRFO_15404 [Tritrichomonas foetus]|eukprot:OHT14249.1 hypothetical protein TRFO_15404 [Tritrichomonas foetus]